jgi:pimeloyl-ACP methyl ester carboxylesterase
MIKTICISAISVISFSTLAQKVITIDDALNTFGFTEQEIVLDSDTITYYLRNYTTKPNNLVVYIQGTDPYPVFFYQKKRDGTTKLIKWFNDDYKTLDSTYTYAIISKPGLSGIFNKDDFSIPGKYHKNNYKEYRVNQIHLTIKDIRQRHLSNSGKIIVYGHSEGAQIAAALATVDKNITHLGFWSGNVLSNFYEFALFERIAVLKGHQTDSAAHANITGLIHWYQDIIENPLSTAVDQWGYTNRRWSSYEEAPIDNLLKIDIPIYAVFASGDESTPIETAYLLPVQFMQNRKDNLTFEICMGCDHSYREKKDGKMINHWNKIFEEFIEWTN